MTAPLNGHAPQQSPGGQARASGTDLVAPSPVIFETYPIDTPAGRTLVLRISTVLGPLHFVMTPDEAIRIGGTIRQQGKAAKTGLTLPPGVALPTDDEDA